MSAPLAAADTLDLGAYRARLLEARQLLLTARSAGDAERPGIVARARGLLSETSAVRTSDGTLMRIDDGRLADRIGVTSSAIDASVADLDVLIAAAARAANPPFDLTLLDSRVAELGGAEKQRSVAADLLTFLQALLQRLFGPPRGAELPGGTMETVITIAGAALLVVIIAIFARGLRERVRRETVLAAAGADGAVDPAVQLAGAEQALEAGDARAALHAFYRYAILAMASRRLFRYEPSLTDREVLERAASLPQVDTLRELIFLHDRSWFGLKGTSPDEALRARALAERAVA